MGKIIVKKKKIKREEEIRAKTSPDEGWSVSHGACLQKHVFPSCNFRREDAEECVRAACTRVTFSSYTLRL